MAMRSQVPVTDSLSSFFGFLYVLGPVTGDYLLICEGLSKDHTTLTEEFVS